MNAHPLIAVSIVNWNTPESTIECLRAVQASTYENFRLIVVDNASRDGSAAKIASAIPAASLIVSSENLGFAAGHSLAIEKAREWNAAAVWLLNSDAMAEPDALAELVAAYRRFGDALYGSAPLRKSAQGTMLDFPQKFFDPDSRPRAWQRDAPIAFDAARREPLPVGAVEGSSMLIPMALIDAHGDKDPAWFLHCEEIDYAYRLRGEGVARYLVPASHVWHAGGGSSAGRARVAGVVAYYRARNEIVLAWRHAGAATALTIAAKKIARGLVTLPADAWRGRCILLGAWHGLRGRLGKTLAPEDFL